MNSSASATVLCIFQLPAISGVRANPAGVAHASTSTPGSCLPSISSSAAPPPVDRWVTRSASPNWTSAAAESPPPTTVDARGSGHRLGHRARAGRERLELERAHRPVPEHRAGARRSRPRRPRQCAGRCRGPSARRGRRPRRASCGSASAPKRSASTRSTGQLERGPGPGSAPRALAGPARRPRRRTASRRPRGPGRPGTESTSRRRSGSCRRPRGSGR